MTLPHRYIENQFVRISRGTLNGLPLLMPGKNGKLCEQIREIFLRDALRFNIVILALNVEPFGYAAIIFDPDMRRSDLLKSVNQCISMKVKKNTTHRESLWSNRKPENVPILDLESLENEIFEVCITPIKKGFIRKYSEWALPQIGPSEWPRIETTENSKSQKSSESKKSDMDDLPNFSLPKPAFHRGPGLSKCGLEEATIDELRVRLIERICSFEAAEEERRKNSETEVLGDEACRLKRSFSKRSIQNWEEYRPTRRAAICADESSLRNALDCLSTFYCAYRIALAAFIETKVSSFPGGILKMRTVFKLASTPIPKEDAFHFII